MIIKQAECHEIFSGASIKDVYDCLKPLLKKAPGTKILDVGTNNCVTESSNKVLNEIMSLKQNIKISLPERKMRLGNGKVTLSLEVHIVDNGNIVKKSLGKKGLHLNLKGSGKLAINFIKKSRTCKKMI